ncbi:hypothetical protein AAVH_27844 [Aphelenchoides avenae]|nr:hypothetical protein AAVH_27844 [Aphelenchus avenae]
MRKTKTLLASENFVDIFSLLSRWQLDPAIISCRQFGYIVSTMMDAVCLREFHAVDFVALNESTIEVKWHFSLNGEVVEAVALLTHHKKEKEAIMRITSRIRSSAVVCITFWRMVFADEWLAEVIEAMGSVNVNQLVLTGCDFSSASEASVRDLISTFTSLRDLTLSTLLDRKM